MDDPETVTAVRSCRRMLLVFEYQIELAIAWREDRVDHQKLQRVMLESKRVFVMCAICGVHTSAKLGITFYYF
jgi:hypothetical protein